MPRGMRAPHCGRTHPPIRSSRGDLSSKQLLSVRETVRSSQRRTCRIPFLVVLVAACAAGFSGGALAVSPAPDPAPGTQVSPRPDAASAAPARRSRAQPSRRSPETSTRRGTAPARSNAPSGRSSAAGPRERSGVAAPRPAIAAGAAAPAAAATRVLAPPTSSGRDDTLLLGAAVAFGTLVLASLGLLGLARRLRQEVAAR
jgi:hypothetical protein